MARALDGSVVPSVIDAPCGEVAYDWYGAVDDFPSILPDDFYDWIDR